MGQFNGKPAVILLAEDDPGDQELTRRALEQSRIRNELHIVEDGEEALDYLLRRGKYEDPTTSPKPDLMLLDLNMPKMDGKQLLEQMRADPRLRRIPVVALTTSKQENDIVRTYDLGANSYIVKPVNMDQFVSAIKILKDYWFQIVVLPPRGE
ncbi:MAG: chemotaxis protein CheY [candidate division Zixibacteria bacterium SM23_73_3]|nr:MAG: chemotaxis protein CheY [candidate division Zixibacteria bacterium SM23_73_3]